MQGAFAQLSQEYADGTRRTHPAAMPRRAPEPSFGEGALDSLQLSQMKYFTLLRYADATVMEADLTTGLYHLVYLASGDFELLRAGGCFEEAFRGFVKNAVHPDDQALALELLGDYLDEFFREGLMRRSRSYRDVYKRQVLDLSDKFVMPGLIDAHLHTNISGEPSILHAFVDGSEGAFTITSIKNAQRNLMAGFTSVRDEGGFRYTDVAVRDAINKGMIVGPRMMVSGEALTGTGGHADSHLAPYVGGFTSLGKVVNSADEGRKAARLNLKYGADQIKIMALSLIHI